MKSPILFLIFNRADTTRQVFDEIRRAQPPRLYVAADGPRADRPGEKELCEKTRAVVKAVDWPCEVKTLFRDENLGCGKAVSQALTWFFENEPEGIVIEDDIVAHPDFFRYCDELLEKYRDDERVQLIAGRNAFYKPFADAKSSYYMSSFFHIWGWASWRRVWQTYEFDAAKLSKEELLDKMASRLPERSLPYWERVIDMMQAHQCDTWDYQLYFNQILNDRYSIIPFVNMTRNIGFGEGATHTTASNRRDANHQAHSPYPLVHPFGDMRNPEADIVHMKSMGLYIPSLCKRIVSRIVRGLRY